MGTFSDEAEDYLRRIGAGEQVDPAVVKEPGVADRTVMSSQHRPRQSSESLFARGRRLRTVLEFLVIYSAAQALFTLAALVSGFAVFAEVTTGDLLARTVSFVLTALGLRAYLRNIRDDDGFGGGGGGGGDDSPVSPQPSQPKMYR